MFRINMNFKQFSEVMQITRTSNRHVDFPIDLLNFNPVGGQEGLNLT